MGGDTEPQEVEKLALFIRDKSNGRIKNAWYSGKTSFPETCSLYSFNYLKLGPYIEKLGGLDSPETNQRFYRIENGKLIDNTYAFCKVNLKEKLRNNIEVE